MARFNSYQIDRLSKKYLPLLIILQCYVPVVYWVLLGVGKTYQIYAYVIYGLLAFYSICYWWIHRGRLFKEYPAVWTLQVFLVTYVVVSCVKLYFVPSSIYLFQRLQCFCSFMSVGCVFLLMQDGVIKRTFRMWWRFVPWIVLLSLPFYGTWSAMQIMFFAFIFVMLADCLRKQLRFLTYAFVAFFALFCIVQRMDYIFVLAPVTVFFLIRYNLFVSYKKSMALYHLLMWTPIVFFFIAIWSGFNILNFDSYIEGEYVSASGEDMTADTRTFLYQEASESAAKHSYSLWGRTPGYGYDSQFVSKREGTFLKVEGVSPQRYSEVFIVNMFTWCGMIGIVVWFVFFYLFGISTLKRTRNRYVRGLTIYVGVFWICCWFHNPFVAPDNVFMALFIIISLCIQRQFQQMTDVEIRKYFTRMLR